MPDRPTSPAPSIHRISEIIGRDRASVHSSPVLSSQARKAPDSRKQVDRLRWPRPILHDALESSMRLRRCLRWVAPAMASLGLGCLASPSRGYPLYPSSDGARPDESRVAQVDGYVRYVDGADVSPHGESFEVLPGCHIVGTPSTWGDATTNNTAAVIVPTGKVTFALPMKAGYRYTVKVELGATSGPTGTSVIKAYESDGHGTTRTFGPASGTVDPTTCEP